VADDNRADVVLEVGLVVESGTVQGFFVLLDFVIMVILSLMEEYFYANFSEDAVGGVAEIVLAIDVEEGGGFGLEATAGDHLGSVESLAHGDAFKMFDVVVQNGLVLLGMEHSTIEILHLHHCA
jgi:hypothetical protein